MKTMFLPEPVENNLLSMKVIRNIGSYSISMSKLSGLDYPEIVRSGPDK